MNLTYLPPLANHLWQSTVFAGVAVLLTVALRRNHARVRHWVWLAASCKFLIPLSLLIALGAHIQWRTAPEISRSDVSLVMAGVGQAFTPLIESSHFSKAAPAVASPLPAMLWGIWACGFLGIAAAWWVRWRRFRTAISRGTPVQFELPLPVVCVSTLVEPGVFGIFRPVLLMPEGIFGRLTPAQLEAVIAHELCHVRHRDNLIAAVHMFVETVFWFHPLVWWIGKQMVEERERACDEEVLRLGSEPRVYAEGILSICKLYAESPLPCVPGMTGADLKKRIESIMKHRTVLRLDLTRKVVLAVCAIAALALPIAVGIMNAPFARAQSSADQKRLAFDVASVKLASVPAGVILGEDGKRMTRKGSGVAAPRNTEEPGRIHYPLITLRELLKKAWDSYYKIDGPAWLDTQVAAVDATMPTDTTKAESQEMLRNLITDRFGLKFHAGMKDVTGYALVVAKGGPKMKESADQRDSEWARPGPAGRSGPDGFPTLPPITGKTIGEFGMGDRSRIFAQQVTMQNLVELLARHLKTIVTDASGLTKKYDFTLTFADSASPGPTPEASEPMPDIFAAVQSQLGLKLERKPIPVDVFVVDHMARTPLGN